jgi:sarcosine oxidase/L-pipecolate oxidase
LPKLLIATQEKDRSQSIQTMAKPLPSSVIIVGSGVFGLGTAYELATRSKDTEITVLERCPFPAPDGSSIDSSRKMTSTPSDATI